MVVVSGTWMKNSTPQYVNYGEMNAARAVLISRPNSHPFLERTLSLEQPVKVGRSVARERATSSNAIFDCKVLSRHHALLWYEGGKFLLQDTKSSNGTFVNNNRLSTNESEPHEVSSGDIVQFGVDVVENNRKVTHGCIVATLKLYLPDGKEAKASPSVAEGSRYGVVPLDELYKLYQAIQEASQRELCLETKLTAVQQVVDAARRAADESWAAYIGEERLLSRVAALETQLTQAGKAFGEDRLREELKQLQADSQVYQTSAKEALMKAHVERLEAVTAAAEQERARATAENEAMLARENWERAQQELQEVAARVDDEQRKAVEAREAHEQRVKELEARIDELQARLPPTDDDDNDDNDQQPLSAVVDDEEPATKIEPLPPVMSESRGDDDSDTELLKMERILKEDNTRNEADDTGDRVILTEQLPPPVAENKDELNTHKEMAMPDETTVGADAELDDANTETDLSAVGDDADIEDMEDATVGAGDTRTLKYQYQTVCEQKRNIERRLQLETAVKTARIALLEKQLAAEKEEKACHASKAELLREEYGLLEAKYTTCLDETKELRACVDALRATIAAAPQPPPPPTRVCEDRATQADLEVEQAAQPVVEQAAEPVMDAEVVPLDAKLGAQLAALEDEVVALKERFAAATEEKIALGKELVGAHAKYNTLCNRSHNTLFFYVAPLALMVVYLLASSMFS